jgi:two-component system response regulator RegA
MDITREAGSMGVLLVVDDDTPLRKRLSMAMERRGFTVLQAESVEEGLQWTEQSVPDYALIDLRLADGSGLDVVARLRDRHPECKVVMMTAYGNIATAVAAVKAGAVDYLAKPADADQVEHALLNEGDGMPPPPADPMPADRVRWEHIQRVYEQCGRNISETARRLQMHRRTLQRILQKHAPKEQTGRK